LNLCYGFATENEATGGFIFRQEDLRRFISKLDARCAYVESAQRPNNTALRYWYPGKLSQSSPPATRLPNDLTMPRADKNTGDRSSLLLELGVPFRAGPKGLLVEAQALNGMLLWAKHFDYVTVCAPQIPSDYADASSIVWADPSEMLAGGRVFFEPLPWGYKPRDHFRYRTVVRRRMDSLVARHKYLCFSNLGVFGCWGGFAVDAARRQNRPYSLWFDWVLHEMAAGQGGSAKERIRGLIYGAVTKRRTDRAIRDCSLGLFHGKTVYDAYAPLCRQPALVHDVHVHPSDAIPDDDLRARVASLGSRSPLRVGYVGRAHPMKAPLQWIDAIAAAVRALGPGRIEATWLGDGPLLDDARAQVKKLALEDSIKFDGFVSDRAAVLAFLRGLDLLVFTHITPESPRCLIEALISGLPLVGYESSYARELVGDRGGAQLSPVGDSSAVAANLIRLFGDRDRLARLTSDAATARGMYNDETVFAHRSDLIKRFL
jgi:glycosyltransferase involved in cell wall biosynthesis